MTGLLWGTSTTSISLETVEIKEFIQHHKPLETALKHSPISVWNEGASADISQTYFPDIDGSTDFNVI